MNSIFRSSSRLPEYCRNGKLRKRNRENRALFKFERRMRGLPKYTVDKLGFKMHSWFDEKRIKALAKEHLRILNTSWRKNELPQKESLALVKDMKTKEHEMYFLAKERLMQQNLKEEGIESFYSSDFETLPAFYKKQFENYIVENVDDTEFYRPENLYSSQIKFVTTEQEWERRRFHHYLELMERGKILEL